MHLVGVEDIILAPAMFPKETGFLGVGFGKKEGPRNRKDDSPVFRG